MNTHDRRTFLRTFGLAAVAISAFGCASFAKDEDRFVGDCQTTDDILGPFYRRGAPVRSDLTYDGQEGDQVLVFGKVYSDDCTTVLKDAKVEIWFADNNGDYDNDSDEYRNRGTQVTEENGEYEFKGILPGRYLNGSQYRPSHMHFRVTANGYAELISQIYFTGDPYISKDPWASKSKAEKRILNVVENDYGREVTFDIFLKKMA